MMVHPHAEKPGAVLREAINRQLEIQLRPNLDLSTLPLRGNSSLRGRVLIKAGEEVSRIGAAEGNQRLVKVGASVVKAGQRAQTAGWRTRRR